MVCNYNNNNNIPLNTVSDSKMDSIKNQAFKEINKINTEV